MPTLHEMIRLVSEKTSLKELIAACPELWQETGATINSHLGGLLGATTRESSSSLNEYVSGLDAKARVWGFPSRKGRLDRELLARAFPDLIRARMAKLALNNYYLTALAGKSGKIRFSAWNGIVLQKLLFRRGFERKPVSLFWYGLMWRFVSQKNILMRLVYQKGIYCFYSRTLVREIAALIRAEIQAGTGEKVLEIAAGDGTLSRFLAHEGIDIVACDDYSWQSTSKEKTPIQTVLQMDAAEAVRNFQPAVAICSWPPAGNNFEKAVFENAATRLYIVIGSRHQFASGNWETYAKASRTLHSPGTYTMVADARLSNMVLPRELDNLVLIFRGSRSHRRNEEAEAGGSV